MKKSDLSDLIKRKKILKESLDIINEVGGFDDPDLMSQFHGNYFDELTKVFLHFDDLSNELANGLSKIMDDEEKKNAEILLKKYVSFMDEYHNMLINLQEKVNLLSKKATRGYSSDMGTIGLNEDNF